MRTSLNVLIVLLFTAMALCAELIDPFYIKIECDDEESYCFISDLDDKKFFYFDRSLSTEIATRIRFARILHKAMIIDPEKLGGASIKVNLYRHYINKDVLYLRHKIGDYKYIDKVIDVSDSPLYYEFIEVPISEIKSVFLFNYKYISIEYENQIKKYWITNKQRAQLLKLINHNFKSIKINLSALEHDKPYRNLISPSEVFMENTDMN